MRAKKNGGKATKENGALLCRSCHDWLEQLSTSERANVNKELKDYKKSFSIEVAEVTTEGINQTQIIEPDYSGETITIPLEEGGKMGEKSYKDKVFQDLRYTLCASVSKHAKTKDDYKEGMVLLMDLHKIMTNFDEVIKTLQERGEDVER